MRIVKYTPSLLAPSDLEAIFVQRHRLAEQLVDWVRDSALTKSKHYSLLIGPEGIGKTHLISLVYHRIVAKDELKDKLAIAWLRENEWGIGSFFDLVLRILRSLDEAYPEARLDRTVETLYAQSPKDAEDNAVKLLKEFLSDRQNKTLGDRTLLLLMENLDEVFHGLGEEGQKKLRSLLQETSCCTIIATSQRMFNGVKLQTSPFYGFFRVRYLKELTVDDAIALLIKISVREGYQDVVTDLSSPKGQNRVQAIHHLVGGKPRLYVALSAFLSRESLDELIGAFIHMLDEGVGFYQAQLTSLSSQQQKIIEVLVNSQNAIPVKVISQRCFASPQTTSSQLKDLREKAYVKSEVYGRQAFYELYDPLMRHCLSIKHIHGTSVRQTIKFLRNWYSSLDFQATLDKLDNHDQTILDQRINTMRALDLAQVTFSQTISERSLAALDTEIKSLEQSNRNEGWNFSIGLTAVFKAFQETNQWEIWLIRIIQCFQKYEYLDAIALGLAQHCEFLVSPMVSQTAIEAWCDVWHKLMREEQVLHLSDRIEFQIPLRLLKGVVEYKKAPNDPRVFLALPMEERKVLKQLLGIKEQS